MNVKWNKIKKEILGEKFTLSVVHSDTKTMKALNKKYRKKKGVPNILSFPLSKEEGEIFINKKVAEKEAKKMGANPKDYIDYLFVHSALHLKGYKHGKKMEDKEAEIMKKFKIWQEKS